LSPRSATTWRNSFGKVSCPCTVNTRRSASVPAAFVTRVATLITRSSSRKGEAPPRDSSPSLLPLPPPRPPHAPLLHPEVELLDVLRLEEARARVFHHDPANFQHVAVVRDVERHVGVLLHQQHGDTLLPVDPDDDLEDLLHELRREAKRGLIEQHHLG